jgi:hypothetical protein
MSKARPVKRNHAVFLRRLVEQTAGFEIFDHAPVAMEQNQRNASSPIDVVEADALNSNEPPDRRITALSSAR